MKKSAEHNIERIAQWLREKIIKGMQFGKNSKRDFTRRVNASHVRNFYSKCLLENRFLFICHIQCHFKYVILVEKLLDASSGKRLGTSQEISNKNIWKNLVFPFDKLNRNNQG